MSEVFRTLKNFISPSAQPVMQPAQPVMQPIVRQMQPVPIVRQMQPVQSYMPSPSAPAPPVPKPVKCVAPTPKTPSTKRSFTIVTSDVNDEGGRYMGKTPMNAAHKASRQLFRKTTKNLIRFVIKETSRSHDKKTYSYVATREQLREPKVVLRGNKEIKYSVVYSVKPCLSV